MSSWTLDFETMPIGPRPEHYPPRPVGLAWRSPNGAVGYETSKQAMLAIQVEAFDNMVRGCRVAFHNGKFDMHVAAKHFGLRFQDFIDQVDDTMIMGFLIDPYARTLGLKPLADQWLGWAQDEKDECVEWILANKDRLPTFPWLNGGKRPTKKTAGAWLAWVPEEILAPYAIGDVERTHALATVWRPIIERMGMSEAYKREMGVMPIFMQNEEEGMRCDREALAHDIETYHKAFDYVEGWLRWRLNAGGLNFDADADVANVLESQGIVTQWVTTASGQKSTSKDNLHPDMFADQQVAQMLGYRNRLKTALKMFMEPWHAMAEANNGRIHTDWNQVQGDQGGTKTGRPSTRNPNFLNISKSFEGRDDGYVHPEGFQLPHLPLVRKYILPEEGHVLLKRDFSGQELHVFGHFEHGELQAKYREDPNLDVHNFVGAKAMSIMGREIPRGNVKILNFQGMYGGGVPAAQKQMRVSYNEAKAFKDFHDQALPGRKILSETLGMIVQRGQTVRTWGGRLYARPPFLKEGNQLRPADYRLLNYLIQGSSADITKTAMLNLVKHPDYKSKFMLQVYDEMNISAPVEDAVEQMLVLKTAMESVPLRTTLPTDGSYGFNWSEMQKIKNDEEWTGP